ncbi:hypothetical protein HDU85_003605 [Gaertneriomyces sp. JEL0708]|nr:hypothetical protein HDU85_003605 [Gaertneriomyces sp. JEL0708]
MKWFLLFALLTSTASFVHALPDVHLLGGPGMALRLSPEAIYPHEKSYRNLMERGTYSEAEGAEIQQKIQYESRERLWSSLRDYTIELWVKPGTNEGRTCCWPLLETYDSNDSSKGGIVFKIVDEGAILFSVRQGLSSSNPCFQQERSDKDVFSAFPPGKWSHIAAVFDATNGKKTIYGNGVVISQWDCTTGEHNDFSGGSYTIGWTKLSTPPGPYHGDMDEIRMWAVARTQAQIQERMNQVISDTGELSQMVFYYNMDEYDLTKPFALKDVSPNERDVMMAKTYRQAPKYVPSTAPVAGARNIETRVIRGVQGSGSVEINLVNPDIATGLSINIVSFPTCSLPGVVLSSNGVTVTSTARSFLASDALVITAPSGDINTPREEACAVEYEITDGATTSPSFFVHLIVVSNRTPVAGASGGALYCDGDDFAYSKDFTFNRPKYGEYTIELWTYNYNIEFGGVATVYSVGNNEIGVDSTENWCLTTDTNWTHTDHCIGRFKFDQYTASGRAEVYNSWDPAVDAGFLSMDISQYGESWKHVAIVSTTDTLSMYLNGELLGSTQNEPFYGSLDGLYLCHWPIWGPYHWFKGFIDEFRVFNYARSRDEIQSTLFTILSGDEPGLIGYWNFDEYADQVAFNDTYNEAALIPDQSNSHFDLVPGGCTPNTPKYCPLGEGRCLAESFPQRPCYDLDGTTQLAARRPSMYPSNAPIGGYHAPIVVEPGEPTSIVVNAVDPDGDVVLIQVTSVPDRGSLFLNGVEGTRIEVGDTFPAGTTITFFNPNEMMGGSPATQFTYTVTDGIETQAVASGAMQIHVRCPPSTYLDRASNTCVTCGRGRFSTKANFDNKCESYTNILSSSPVGVVIAAFTTIGLVLAVAMAVIVIRHRNTKIIKSASPVFCILIIAGCALGMLDAFMHLDIPNATMCILQPMLVAVAFTLSMGNLVVKTARVHLVFNHPLLARRLQWLLHDSFLVGVSAVAVAMDLIVLIAWFLKDRPRPLLLEDINGRTYWGCDSLDMMTSKVASGILASYNGLWLLAGIYSAYQVRNVKSAYNESQHIIPCIYIILLGSAILLAVNYAGSLFTYQVRVLFVSFLLCVCGTLVIGQLFIPKVIALRNRSTEGEKPDKLHSLTTSANSPPAGRNAVRRTASEGLTAEADFVGSDFQEQEMQSFQNGYQCLPLVQAQVGGGLLNRYTAHSIYLLGGLKVIVLQKYRQNTSLSYSYFPGSVQAVDEYVICLRTTDLQNIRLKFNSRETRDAWQSALQSGRPLPSPVGVPFGGRTERRGTKSAH